MDQISSVRSWIARAQRIVVLTGAGISTDSGIPDFRGPQGVWTRNPSAEKLATLQNYLTEPEVRKAAWRSRATSPAWAAQPNPGHRALLALEARSQLLALITQNIDGLHQKAGHAPERVIEVHGTIHGVTCWRCGWKGPMLPVLWRVKAGEEDPSCEQCGGILKSDTISFGQALVPEVISRAMHAAAKADLFLAVGTSLQVYPIANAVATAHKAGARVVIVNAQETPFDGVAAALMREPIGVVLPLICCAAQS